MSEKSWVVLYSRMGCSNCDETWWDYEEPECKCVEETVVIDE